MKDRNRALDGDEVVVKLYEKDKWKVNVFNNITVNSVIRIPVIQKLPNSKKKVNSRPIVI